MAVILLDAATAAVIDVPPLSTSIPIQVGYKYTLISLETIFYPITIII